MPANPSILDMLFPAVLIFLIFHFLVFKPQKEEQKKKQEMKEGVKKNDKIITVGGIHGTVVNIKEKSVIVRVDDNVKIEFDKESISEII